MNHKAINADAVEMKTRHLEKSKALYWNCDSSLYAQGVGQQTLQNSYESNMLPIMASIH